MEKITIISVYHSDNSRKLLECNEEFARERNQGAPWEWIAVYNTPEDYAGVHADANRFTLLPGMPMSELEKTLEPWQQSVRAGYHHIRALEKAFPLVTSRFVLILDSDFYLVYPHWVKAVLSYMKEKNLAFLGPPWHPRWWKKKRYFPVHHALFIDTHALPLSLIMLDPQYTTAGQIPTWENLERRLLGKMPFLRVLPRAFLRRLHIGASRDASYAFYQKYYRSALRYELFTPVHNPFIGMSAWRKSFKQFVRLAVPDRLSYVPRPGTYSTRTFKERGYFNASGRGWEEFVWQDRPFGFHMRSFGRGYHRPFEKDYAALDEGLEDFVRVMPA